MVAFTQDPTKANDPSYLGYSQGTEKAKIASLYPVPNLQESKTIIPESDKSLATLFKGVGEIGVDVIEATDKVLKYEVDKKLYQPIRNIQDQFGVGAAADLASGTAQSVGFLGSEAYQPGQPIPDKVKQSIDRMGNRIAGLQSAYETGDLNNSAYGARLESYVRQIKAQYPGYEEYIDGKTQQITGIIPANFLRSALLQDVTDLNRKLQASADKDRTFLQSHLKDLPPDHQFLGGSNNYTMAQTYSLVASKEAQRAKWQDEDLRINAQMKVNQWNGQEVEKVVGDRFSKIVNDSLNTTLDAQQPNGLTFLKAIQDKIAENKPWDPATKQQVVNQLNILEGQYKAAWEAMVTKSLGPDGVHTFRQAINDPAKEKALYDQGLGLFTQLKNSLLNPDTGTFAMTTRLIAAQKNDKIAQLLTNENLNTIYAMREIAGSEALPLLLQKNPRWLSGVVSAVSDLSVSRMTQGLSTLTEETKSAIRNNITDPGNNQANISKGVALITSPDIKPEAKAQLVRSFFDGGVTGDYSEFMRMFKQSEWSNVYTQMASPAVEHSVAELEKQYPGVYAQYSSWVYQNFQTLSKQNIDSVNKTAANRPDLKLVFNPGSNRFQYLFNGTAGPGRFAHDQNAMVNMANRQLEPLNSAISSLAPVMKHDNIEMVQGLINLYGGPNLPTNTPVGKALFEAGGQSPEGPKEPPREATPSGDNRLGLSLQGTEADKLRPVLDMIGQGENAGNYEGIFGNTRLPVTKLTVGQLMAVQKYYTDNGQESSAAGKYQILRNTLASLVKDGIVSEKDLFDAETQDKLAVALLHKRGLKEYASGQLTRDAFVNSLAQEWAGVPQTNGVSFYHGVGSNKATVSLPKVFAALKELE